MLRLSFGPVGIIYYSWLASRPGQSPAESLGTGRPPHSRQKKMAGLHPTHTRNYISYDGQISGWRRNIWLIRSLKVPFDERSQMRGKNCWRRKSECTSKCHLQMDIEVYVSRMNVKMNEYVWSHKKIQSTWHSLKTECILNELEKNLPL